MILKPLQLPQIDPRRLEEPKVLAVARVNQGMISSVDGADLPNEALTVAKEVRCRFDVTHRRSGKLDNLPAKPNANKILNVFLVKKNDASTHFLRFTRNSIHKRQAASWLNYIAGVGGALTCTDNDRYSVIVMLNKIFFANGVDKIQEVDTVAGSYKEAGTNSPKVKYITGFFNRIVGAYRVEPTEANGPVTLVWCADGDTTKWPNDASPDISCGQSPLIESPSDLADFISGVFGGPNVMMVLRERSLWAATKQPSASNPFFFVNSVPGIGCDSPHSADVITGGVAFLDTLSGAVWAWSPGSSPERISTNIERELVASVSNPNYVFGSYDARNFEYSIAIPAASTNVVKVWTYNFRTKAWVFDEIPALSEIVDLTSPFQAGGTFDDLAGTFDSLTGTFDALGGVNVLGNPARYYGYDDGSIYEESDAALNDAGVAFTSEIQSKDFYAPQVDMYVSEIRIEYRTRQAGTITLSYSRDSGKTWVFAKSEIVDPDDKPEILRYARHIWTHRLRWKIEWDTELSIIGYEVHVYQSGVARE